MIKEFKEFALKGNVIDMGVGIIIGTAFGNIITSFVSDILMPPLGLILGNVDFSNLFLDMSGKGYQTLAEAKTAGAATLNYGLFINKIVDFVLVAFALFILIKQVQRLQKPVAVAAAAPTKECPHCCNTIPAAATRCGFCTSEL